MAGRGGVRNARFEQADAQTRAFPAAGFDVALSSFGVMFFDDPGAAFANIARALRPGGRLAFLCWQETARNEFLAVPLAAVAAHAALPELPGGGEPGPFSLAHPQRIRSLLAGAGFGRIGVDGLEEPMRVGDDVDDVIGYYRGLPIARQMLTGAGEQATAAVLESLRDALRPHQGSDGVTLRSAAWLVTAQQ
jgi:SAM-dependent methyltransferase